MTCALSAQISKQCWPRVTVPKPGQGTKDASALRGWRHTLVRGVLRDWDVHHGSGFSLKV